MSAHDAVLVVPHRFRGPARSGNGGWTAGTLAERVPVDTSPATVEVTLRMPPPLEVTLTVDHLAATGDHAAVTVLCHQGERVAEARAVGTALTPVEAVGPDEAAAAMTTYPGLRSHPFPGCFACGPDRAAGDGLHIFPGPVGPDTVASLWVPHASLAESGDVVDPGVERVGSGTTWAALDCVGGWSEDLEGRPMVLGRMTARVDARPVVGEPHVVVGRRLRSEGRKTFTASTLYDADGRVVATAEHVWLAVDPAVFN
ncbi:hypothetical protein H9L09_13140 [Nocardioides mesophilus]|uniref:Thioesterase family protein n=1 Tax=Nocardioides mesophilus TaxID=433659 RepID=A0A7G9RHG3_9ACTN|nr:hypothetical protein H9L09_13140 [Nocardioides mesophilus]